MIYIHSSRERIHSICKIFKGCSEFKTVKKKKVVEENLAEKGGVTEREKDEEQGVRTAADQGLNFKQKTNVKNLQRKETIALLRSWNKSRVGRKE